jgi:hypothetical protein
MPRAAVRATAQGTTLGLTALTGMRPCSCSLSKSAGNSAQASWLSGVRTRGAARYKTRPCQPLISRFPLPNVSSERTTTASAVISTRLPVRHVFPACKPLHLVFTLCKIDLRPRRPRTWCHLSLAASSDDHDQAYFPIGFTQLHACACCAWLHEYRRDVVTTAFDCLYRARIGRPGGTRTTLRLREDDTTTKSNTPLISPHSFKACSHGLDLLSILQRRRDGFRCWPRGV